MNNGKNLDREGASTSTPRRVEKVGEAQLIEDSAGRLAISRSGSSSEAGESG